MLLFNKTNLVSLVLALNLSTGVVRADFNNILNEIGGIINGSGNQQKPQQQAQQQQPAQKMPLSNGTNNPESPESNESFEKLFGNDQFCVIPGFCKTSSSSKVPEPTTSPATKPASTTSKQDVPTSKPTSQPTSSSGPTSTSSATSTNPTTITPSSTSSSSNPGPTNTTPSNTDWGSIALLFFNLFKNLVETILKSFNKS